MLSCSLSRSRRIFRFLPFPLLGIVPIGHRRTISTSSSCMTQDTPVPCTLLLTLCRYPQLCCNCTVFNKSLINWIVAVIVIKAFCFVLFGWTPHGRWMSPLDDTAHPSKPPPPKRYRDGKGEPLAICKGCRQFHFANCLCVFLVISLVMSNLKQLGSSPHLFRLCVV